ncbi:MAG TPA: LacI family DNA-binding transcriptional regulator [Gammaproteobacteria bacterium]|nr:LacI family DNA-binding transcriptional regulator [Gammaproteobacteria bacterium]
MDRSKARSNIKDVARRAGVHPSTVSRVLNPATRSMVSASLAEEILRIAAELGYRRNPLASGLRTRKTYTVGIIIPDLTNPVFPPIVRGAERALDAGGYIAILADSGSSDRSELEIVENMRARDVDGLILATAKRRDPVVGTCVEQGIPLVLVNRTVSQHNVAAVINDDELGIELALEHLRALGHERIAYIGGPQSTSTGYVRYHAFLKRATGLGAGLDKALIVNATAFTEPAGARALATLLDTGKRFTAVLTANDLLALGCYDTLRARKLRCPDDISVTGFNDMPFVDRIDPPLTTVHIPHDELGVQAARLLLERIENRDATAIEMRLKPTLVARGSTTRAPG